MRTSKRLSLVICFVLVAALAIVPMFTFAAFAADGEVTFELGANGSASHADGSSKTSYTETVGDYTLDITGATNFYTGARDDKGNSCFKLGTSSKTASFTINVPADVTEVIIRAAKYKANTSKLSVNGTTHTLSGASTNGEYDEITVDTTSTKTVSVATVSGGLRAMINSITFVTGGGSSEPACEHTSTTTTTVEATCTKDGETTVTCNDCGDVVSTEVIKSEGHNYVGGVCTVCREEEPNEAEATLDFSTADNRLSWNANQQVWQQNGVTFTNDKAASTNAIIDSSNPVRLYANSSITIEVGGKDITKIEFVCNTAAYASSLKNSIGSEATVNGTTVTVTLATPATSYTVAKLSAQVRVNSLTVYYLNAGGECTHEKTTTSATNATCTENGKTTVTCNDCGEVVSSDIIQAPGHNFVDGKCTVCGWYDGTNVPTGPVDGDSSTIDFSTKDDRLQYDSEMQIWAQNGVVLINKKGESTTNVGDYADPVRFYKNSSITISSAKEIVKIEFVCNTTGYADALAESIGSEATADGKIVTVTLADPAASYTFTPGAAVWINSFTAYYEPEITEPTITTATVTVGQNLAMNYTVALPKDYVIDGMKMVFTMNGVSVTVEEDGTNVFTYTRLAPQCMGDTITAELYSADGTLVDTLDYSVKAYAEDLLALYANNEYVTQLVVDMLNYGAAAQVYRDYKTDALVNAGLTATGSTVTPTDADNKLNAKVNEEIDPADYADYGFYAVGVRFDYVNKIFVRFKAPTLDGVTVLANGVAINASASKDGYVAYSGAISALAFDEVVTFELQVNGVTIQTLEYSVNTYSLNKYQGGDAMADLALALYRYGASAVAYNENN